MKMSGHSSLEKYTSPFSRLLGCSTGGLEAQPLWNMVLNPASSLQLTAAQSGVLRAPSAGCWFSLQHLISNSSEALNSNCSIGGPEGPSLLGAGSHYSILSPTHLNFLSPGLYNNLTSTLLPASVTISHSIQPLDSQGYILIFLDRMHLLFTQVQFLFWQLGRVRGQYTTLCLPWSDY